MVVGLFVEPLCNQCECILCISVVWPQRSWREGARLGGGAREDSRSNDQLSPAVPVEVDGGVGMASNKT